MDRELSSGKVMMLGVYLFALLFVLVAALLAVFSWMPLSTETPEGIVLEDIELESELAFLLLVLLAAALGSYIHAATSFVSYVGNQKLRKSWTSWYILRPHIGIALGLVFYFVVRGGFLAISNDMQVKLSGMYFIMGIAGLVGLFSKQATDKLREIADSLFRTPPGEGDAARADKLGEQVPVKDAMLPSSKIKRIGLTETRREGNVNLSELHAMLAGNVTRIPVFEKDGSALYVIHESVLLRGIADEAMKSARQPGRRDPRQMTLADLLADENVRRRVSESMAFIPAGATLADAMAAMRNKEDCRDVFVTRKGTEKEPVLGWLTNIDVERHCRV